MATTFQLTAEKRAEKGKGAARKLRAQARIPGVLYGKGEEPVMLQLPVRDFLRTVGGHSVSNMIIDLLVNGEAPVKTLIREIQVDPLTNEVLHVDLNRISMTERIEIEVPVELTGVPVGVKDFGGILSQPIRSLTVLCLAADVPEVFEIDVSGLGIGDAVHASDITREGVEVLTDPDTVIANVNAPAAAEEPAAGEEGEEAKEPEVISEKKDEDEKEGGKN